VLEDLRANPGTTYLDATVRLAQTRDQGALTAYRTAIANLDRILTKAGGGIRRDAYPAVNDRGQRVPGVRLYLEEPQPQASEPEPELELEG
jgi:hypothetical protein